MRNNTPLTQAGKQYAEAYAMQYATKNLHDALELYRDVRVAHPNTKEAEYSRQQIQNIVINVVPEQRLLDAQLELAFSCLKSQL